VAWLAKPRDGEKAGRRCVGNGQTRGRGGQRWRSHRARAIQTRRRPVLATSVACSEAMLAESGSVTVADGASVSGAGCAKLTAASLPAAAPFRSTTGESLTGVTVIVSECALLERMPSLTWTTTLRLAADGLSLVSLYWSPSRIV